MRWWGCGVVNSTPPHISPPQFVYNHLRPSTRVLSCRPPIASRTRPSLYLKQHANNPVDWYPWGPERWPVHENSTGRSSSRSATRRATGATSWSTRASRTKQRQGDERSLRLHQGRSGGAPRPRRVMNALQVLAREEAAAGRSRSSSPPTSCPSTRDLLPPDSRYTLSTELQETLSAIRRLDQPPRSHPRGRGKRRRLPQEHERHRGE